MSIRSAIRWLLSAVRRAVRWLLSAVRRADGWLLSAVRRAPPGTWPVRDWFWTALGLIVIDEFAGRVGHSSGNALKYEAAGVVLAALVGALLLPRSGAVVPNNPTRGEDADAIEAARRRARVFLAVLVVGWIGFRLGDVGNVSTLLVTALVVALPAVRGGDMRHRDAAWAALGAAGVYLYLDLDFAAPWQTAREIVLAVIAVPLARFLMRRRFGVHVVRALAALAGGAAAYGVVNALVAAPFVVLITLILTFIASILLAIAIAAGSVPWLPRGVAARIAIAVGVLVLGWPLFAGLGVGSLWASGLLEHQLSESGVSNRGAHPDRHFPTITDDGSAMAREYEPFLAMPKGERWRPSSATDYLREAKLVRAKPRQKVTVIGVASPRTLATCRGGRGADCRLTIDCQDPDKPCADERKTATGRLYARVVAGRNLDYHYVPDFGEIRWLIQYWVFYRYDDWTAWAFKGFRQWHESDWELVSVGLGRSRPLFAAFSAHCGGIWQPWSKIAGRTDGGERSDGSLRPGHPRGHHVVAFVARGSHASYPDAVVHAPDWESCANKVPAAMEAALWGPTYSSALREHMSYARPSESYVAPDLIPISDRTPWLQYAGRWGLFDHFRYLWQGGDCPQLRSSCGGGPQAPPTQTSWTDPIGWIFCSRHFQPKGRCPVPAWKPRLKPAGS